ncbi:MAG: UDP-N-acetylglucosamine 1-carboxyvinyltransferase, partial [Clostridia bacterium]|nr:UDP-N-acetylglucosamine 1-carboxyvinyltransferase [Clostridia bacterium]
CLAEGKSTLTEGVWDSRFRYVEELKRMGAQITVEKSTAEVTGVPALNPAKVRAVDLRAGAAMVIAALAADGKSEVEEIYHIERGYEDIIGKLRSVGADITKITEA